ncbi:hypothetical protein E3N88_35655 [Mikania micrantha]|uniref:Uncharacterized protein n=1 Tax=Mikania micrantha TaxID=192012 RepID=A0A5N6M1K3_9ASTR|nr:hypothetical protein E3N88_35655 [Mikania micrantha]
MDLKAEIKALVQDQSPYEPRLQKLPEVPSRVEWIRQGFIQVKFHDDSPFETHGYLIIMSLVALPVAITTSGILFYTDDPRENTNISDIRYVILNFVFFFSTIVAVLSLVLVLFVPAKFNWTGYAIICALFTFMVACNLCFYGRLHVKKDVPNSINLEMV